LVLAAAGVLRWANHIAPQPAFTLRVEANRGAPANTAPAGVPLNLVPDLAGLPAPPPYRLEMVDAAGQLVWRGTSAAPHVPPRTAGTYFLRAYAASGALLREYGIEIGHGSGNR
jgi:hypothetical protein